MKKIYFIVFTFLFSIQTFSQIESEMFLEGGKISGIAGEKDYLWVSTNGYGIFRYSYEDGKWTNFSTQSRNLDNDIFYNIAVGPDYVWAGSAEGLFTYDKKRNQWRKRKFAVGGEFGNWIRSLCYDPADNTLWIGRFRNLTRLDVSRNRFTDFDLTKRNDPKTNTFIAIKTDGDSVIYFSTEAGIHKYLKKTPMTGAVSTEFIDNKSSGFNGDGESVSVSDMLFEYDNIWFATDEFITAQKPSFNIGGIYKYDRRFRWERFSRQNGMPANGIYCLEKVGNSIWAGVYAFDKKDKKEFGKGLVIINRFTNQVIPIDLNETALVSSSILALHFDGTDMWIGTDTGLLRMKVDNPLARWDGRQKITEKKPSVNKKK
jgi:ligand-binding sensor domain-containing protein